MQETTYGGWKCLRLANGQIELIVTRDVGPRVIRFGFIDGPNLFGEIAAQRGGRGETEWMIRGGHRFWVAPEAKPWSYEPDNVPYASAEEVAGGVRLRQAAGAVTGLAKEMTITLDADRNAATVAHRLVNKGRGPVECAAWALSVMALRGQAIVPLPAKIPHVERLTHNQTWSIWGYTDFADPRWSLGRNYVVFRQDPTRGPNKLGLALREGWVAYQSEGCLFVKQFDYLPDARYPDGGCNFETFSNEEILELESLGPLTVLKRGQSLTHTETWRLFRDVPRCANEADIDRLVRPLI
jgi:hypothetical protein